MGCSLGFFRGACADGWGDGWGWAQFDPKDRSKQIATNYKTDCLQCHVPAKAMDWIYVYAYPALGEKALQFTPEAARSGDLAALKRLKAVCPTSPPGSFPWRRVPGPNQVFSSLPHPSEAGISGK